MSTRPHPYDEDFAPAVSPWHTLALLAETRAPTKPLDPDLLASLNRRCQED